MKALHMITFLLVVVGALNWGLVGLFDWNLVQKIFASVPSIERLIYVLVGVSAVYMIFAHGKDCKNCPSK